MAIPKPRIVKQRPGRPPIVVWIAGSQVGEDSSQAVWDQLQELAEQYTIDRVVTVRDFGADYWGRYWCRFQRPRVTFETLERPNYAAPATSAAQAVNSRLQASGPNTSALLISFGGPLGEEAVAAAVMGDVPYQIEEIDG